MKLSVEEAKLTGLCATNCASIQLVWILKVAFGPEKLPGLSRNRPSGEKEKESVRGTMGRGKTEEGRLFPSSPLAPSIFRLYASSPSPIMHLICPTPTPTPTKFGITFVLHFSWVLQLSQEKLKTMLMQRFGGQIRCIVRGDEPLAYCC